MINILKILILSIFRKNRWLGVNCIILPGVQLGDNVIVGAGSVVTKSFGSDLIIAGNPAKIIKPNLLTK